jgi:small nuclear ribonucleoprotein B and B'
MNLVLADTEEFRRMRQKGRKSGPPGTASAAEIETEEKRTLGLTIVRGTHVVSLTVEGPPPADPSARLGAGGASATTTLASGPGIARPAGRGLPTGLTGPAPGVGGPAPGGFPPGFAPPGFGGRGGPPGKCFE